MVHRQLLHRHRVFDGSRVFAEPDQRDAVVQLLGVARVGIGLGNATHVHLHHVRVNANRQRPVFDQGSRNLVLDITDFEEVLDEDPLSLRVLRALPRFSGVGVLLFALETGVFRDQPLVSLLREAAVTPVVLLVAVDKLLFGEGVELLQLHEGSALHVRRGGEGPTAAALPLVLHGVGVAVVQPRVGGGSVLVGGGGRGYQCHAEHFLFFVGVQQGVSAGKLFVRAVGQRR
mmetsp:Transcript_9252/g.22723  ORF Transcript_9252/g.22723 Transcript_9252/m.22723 type:complete len:231 (+) Transcript_9252:1291-1983(+)